MTEEKINKTRRRLIGGAAVGAAAWALHKVLPGERKPDASQGTSTGITDEIAQEGKTVLDHRQSEINEKKDKEIRKIQAEILQGLSPEDIREISETRIPAGIFKGSKKWGRSLASAGIDAAIVAGVNVAKQIETNALADDLASSPQKNRRENPREAQTSRRAGDKVKVPDPSDFGSLLGNNGFPKKGSNLAAAGVGAVLGGGIGLANFARQYDKANIEKAEEEVSAWITDHLLTDQRHGSAEWVQQEIQTRIKELPNS